MMHRAATNPIITFFMFLNRSDFSTFSPSPYHSFGYRQEVVHRAALPLFRQSSTIKTMLDKLELFWPLKARIVSQHFGANDNTLYAGQGLKGHPGMDLESFWDDVIMAAQDSYVYKRINVGNHDLAMYRAVFS